MINKFLSEIWDWLKTFIIAFACVYLINMFLFSPSHVNGSSMEPTLHDKQWLISNKLAFLVGSPQFGDIVVLENPVESLEDEFLVKRVIGVPGDKIEIKNQHLYRNDLLLVEPYTDKLIEGDYDTSVIVPEGEYFVMGDNRGYMRSNDSRAFGTVKEDLITGKIFVIIWPFSDIKVFGKGGQ